MIDRNLVTALEAARILCVSTGALYKMARLGTIPSYRVGAQRRAVRFDLQELRDALRSTGRGHGE